MVAVQLYGAVYGGLLPLGATGAQLEDQPPKDDPTAGVAVKVTTVPGVNAAEHPAPAPQLMPPNEEVTVPVPLPVL